MAYGDDKIVNYIQTERQSLPGEDKLSAAEITGDMPIMESPYRSKIISSRKARELTRKNLAELQRISGESININM